MDEHEKGVWDLAGNVWEWCGDWYAAYSEEESVDPVGPETGESRVLRGGSFFGGASYLRASLRDGLRPGSSGGRFGFRVVWSSAGGQD